MAWIISLAEAKRSAKYFSNISGGYNIHGVYNATHGKVIDFAECILGLAGIATEPVSELHKKCGIISLMKAQMMLCS